VKLRFGEKGQRCECRCRNVPIYVGIIGHADLTLEGGGRKGAGGNDRSRRRPFPRHPLYHRLASRPGRLEPPIIRPAGLLLDPKVREGFARLAPLGLSFDAWMYHTQLGDLLDLARAFPATPIVLDYVGGAIGLGPYAGKRNEVFAEWSGKLRELAACPNVHIKLGGLGMRIFGFTHYMSEIPPSSEELAAAWRPYIETCIAAFGPERAMFESNFPVDKGSCTYAALWNAFKRIAAGYSAAEKAALFAGTATKFYRLG
jgi:predicted TIM-barrel fold metal-dependent hydrolase